MFYFSKSYVNIRCIYYFYITRLKVCDVTLLILFVDILSFHLSVTVILRDHFHYSCVHLTLKHYIKYNWRKPWNVIFWVFTFPYNFYSTIYYFLVYSLALLLSPSLSLDFSLSPLILHIPSETLMSLCFSFSFLF